MSQLDIYIDASKIELEDDGNTILLTIPTSILLNKGSGYMLSITNKEVLESLQQKYNELFMSLIRKEEAIRDQDYQRQISQNSSNNTIKQDGTLLQNNNQNKQQERQRENAVSSQKYNTNNYQSQSQPQPQQSFNPYAKNSAYQNAGSYNNPYERSSQQQYQNNQQQNYSQSMNIFGNNPIGGGSGGRYQDRSSSRDSHPVQNTFMTSATSNVNTNNNSLFGTSAGPSRAKKNSKYSSL